MADDRKARVAKIAEGLGLFLLPDQVVEVRGLDVAGRRAIPHFGRGADLEQLAWQALRWEEAGAKSVRFTLNPLRQECLANGRKCAADEDVLGYRWLMLDTESVEHAKGVPASEPERVYAWEVLQNTLTALAPFGFATDGAVLMDSGNGWHGFLAVDLPADQKPRVKEFLAELAARVSTGEAVLDPNTYALSQLAKVPELLSRKGTPSPERPHRLAGVVGGCAPTAEEVAQNTTAFARALSTWDIQGRLAKGKRRAPDFAVREEERQRLYVQTAVRGELEKVAGAKAGRANQLYASACALGAWVGSGRLGRAEAEAMLDRAARDCGLHEDDGGETIIKDTIRRGLSQGEKSPRKPPEAERNGRHAAAPTVTPPASGSAAVPASARDQPPPEIITLPDLMAMRLPEPRWAVPGLLCEGLNILAGKPKLGKSFFALNLAITIAAGGKALGDVRVEPGDVLYLSLEDRYRRLQARARKILQGLGLQANSRLHLAITWPRQGAGGMTQIEEWAKRVERPTLAIIDVWARFRTPSKAGGNQYEQDYAAASALKEIADRNVFTAMPVHHCKKAPAEDVLDEVSGTLGLAGAADGLLIMTRSRKDNEAQLFISGRDIEEKELALEFNPQTCCWTSLGPAEARMQGKLQAKILDHLKGLGGKHAFAADIAAAIDEPSDNLRTVLWRMHKSGVLRRVGSGWAYPAEEGQSPF